MAAKVPKSRAPEEEPGESPSPLDVALRVPAATIVKLLVAAGLVFVLIRLLPALLLVFIAVLLAVALDPAVRLLERRGISRSLAVAILAAAGLGAAALFLALAMPPLVAQSADFIQHLRDYRRIVGARLHADYPTLARVADQAFDAPASPEVAKSLKEPLAWGRILVNAAEGIVLTLALSFYLLIDGKRTYAWLLAYVPRRHRRKMSLTMPAVSDVVTAYMQGQAITSAIAGAYAFAVLSLLGVPAALPLALLAAVCDVLPILGIFVSTVPAVLFALTVSPIAAAAVLALYLLYHAIENYVIIPRVYGKRLRLSTLVVLLALILGGMLGGVVGAVLILPVVAAYPIIERIWLRDYLGHEVTADHTVLEQTADSGSDRAVDAILRGARHDAEVHDPGAARAARRIERERS